MKDLHIKHKFLISALSLGVLIFLGLFIWALLEVRTLEQQDAGLVERYLYDEEVVIISPRDTGSVFLSRDPTDWTQDIEEYDEEPIILPVQRTLFQYVQVIDGCEHDFSGECLNVRSGPGTDFPIVNRLRNGIILKVGGLVERDEEGWYKITFDEWLRYPERVSTDWYISANYVRVLLDEGDKDVWTNDNEELEQEKPEKRIVVIRSEQMLYAYEGEDLFMQEPISTGLELTPTPRGEFTIFRKTPSRYMQGPLPGISTRYWDLPGVPWNLYFTHGGAVIHGTYWHNDFGQPASAGCVNIRPDKAEELYKWAELGTKVVIRD